MKFQSGNTAWMLRRRDVPARNRLLAAYAEGVDIHELIARFGRSQDAINQMARRHGVTRPDGYAGTRIQGDPRLPLEPSLRVS